MNSKTIKQSLFYVAAVGVSIVLLFFFIGCSWIGYEVKSQCQDAEREYGGDLPAGRQDCVVSLIALLKDERKGFRAQNDAIWALGELGDRRALPVLQSFYTGNIPSREPLNKMISQYELKKAIALASGGTNITAFIWRGTYGPK